MLHLSRCDLTKCVRSQYLQQSNCIHCKQFSSHGEGWSRIVVEGTLVGYQGYQAPFGLLETCKHIKPIYARLESCITNVLHGLLTILMHGIFLSFILQPYIPVQVAVKEKVSFVFHLVKTVFYRNSAPWSSNTNCLELLLGLIIVAKV